MTDLDDFVTTDVTTDRVIVLVRAAHPNPTIGGTPGSYWLACSCGLYLTAKPSIRACRRSFSAHRINEYAKCAADLRAGRVR